MVSQRMVLLSVVSLVLVVNVRGEGEPDKNSGDGKIMVELLEEELTDQVNEHFNDRLDKVNENNQGEIPLHVICCKIVTFLQQIMPKFMDELPYMWCGRSIGITHLEKDPVKKQDKSCTMLECIFGKFKIIDRDGTINEVLMKEHLRNKTIPVEQDFVSAALNKCFVERNKNPDQGKRKDCKSGAGALFGCIFADILTKCPKQTLWKNDRRCK